MPVVLTVRRGSTADWARYDPILRAGEVGANIDTWELKFGDGATRWSELSVVTDDGDDRDETASYIAMAERIAREMRERALEDSMSSENSLRRSEVQLDETREITEQIDEIRIQIMTVEGQMPVEDPTAVELEEFRAWITPLISRADLDAASAASAKDAAQLAATSASQNMAQTSAAASTATSAMTASSQSAATAGTAATSAASSRDASAASASSAASSASATLTARDQAVAAQKAAEAARAAIEALPKYQDSGWRNIASLVQNGWTVSALAVRRTGNDVELLITGLNPGTADTFLNGITGFRPSPLAASRRWAVFNNLGTKVEIWSVANTGALAAGRLGGLLALGAMWSITWSTTDAWPTTLPGVALA